MPRGSTKNRGRKIMAMAEVGNIEMAYSIDGSGEPVILIGGFTMVKESWELQVVELAKRFRVITLDNRGVGETTVPAEPFTIADMAADTAGLMDVLAIGSAHVIGVSMGGLIAQVLALDYADRVEKVVLGCTSHGGRHAVQPRREVMEVLAKASDPTLRVEESVRMRLPVVFNVKRRLGEIRCPVLVITGSEDRMMPPENARLLAEGIEGAEHYVVNGAGHSFFLEKPDEVNGVLIDFLSK
jgi:pimeloyl-ACP methyl ester carboxylesterase